MPSRENKLMTNKGIGKVFKPSNKQGFLYLISPLFFLSMGLMLLAYGSFLFVISQIFLSVFFFQCFILLHETGHFSYFHSKPLNAIFGNVFAFISCIPFRSWISIHNLHHKWTGYRDKDPTMEVTVSPKFSKPVRMFVNFCWHFFIPVFTVSYRIGNYWNISKLNKHVSRKKLPSIYVNMVVQIFLYVMLFYTFGSWLVIYFLPSYIGSLIISDLFILSQHSHIPIPLSGGNNVRPIRFSDQVKYTRSLILFKGIGKLIYFNFNMHELHHAYPGLPAYNLDKLNLDMPNSVRFNAYLRDAKQMKGTEFIFSTSDKKIGRS